MAVTGVVLAAGAGSRMGTPKALLRTPSGEPWLAVASRLLLEAGCDRVVVVLGASAFDAALLLPADARVGSIVNPRWQDGMASSLRAGLAAASGDAALVTVVDMPGLPVGVVARVLALGLGTPAGDDRPPAAGDADPTRSLARAVFGGRPGHPVLIGSAHWAPLSATLTGDHGGRGYLDAHGVAEVECDDLYDGHDVDVPGAEAR
jgi:CTP:molybdopterin cytidylyltransferase MocA